MVHTHHKLAGADSESALAAANQRLARTLHRPALPLSGGAAHSLRDPLWVWGVLGGKDVGKSSLINALAGSDIAEPAAAVGEGTYRPAVYLTADDATSLRGRFEMLPDLEVLYRSSAPPGMRGLALVDLPDFDSLFEGHADQVRRIAGVLDGIIWVTTPKKVADLRAIREIRNVLKDRANFVYVVNKVDWLLGQSEQAPRQTLERLRSALGAQIHAAGESNGSARAFLISAKYCDSGAMVQAIGRSRDVPVGDLGPEVDTAAADVAREFQELREVLTTTPDASAAQAGKQANLSFQIGIQARQVLEHFRPDHVLQGLDHELGDGRLRDVVLRSFPADYCRQVTRRLNSERQLLIDWTAALVRRRLSYWPIVAVVALPLAAVAALLNVLRGRQSSASAMAEDPFRVDGLALEARVEAVLAGVQRAWGRAVDSAPLSLPDAALAAVQFRHEARAAAADRRDVCIAEALQRRPTWVGRIFRAVLPITIVLWFPLVQPLLSALLAAADGGLGLNAGTLRLVVETLSAGQVLTGLVTAVLLLGLIAAAVYAGALRTALSAVDRLRATDAGDESAALAGPLFNSVSAPIAAFRDDLTAAEKVLRDLAGLPRGPSEDPAGDLSASESKG